MLARAWAVSEEIDKHFINLVFKLALSRRSLLFTWENCICRERMWLTVGTSIRDSRSIYKVKNVIRIMTTLKKNDFFL